MSLTCQSPDKVNLLFNFTKGSSIYPCNHVALNYRNCLIACTPSKMIKQCEADNTMLQQTHTLVKANNHNDDGLYTLIDNIPDSIIVTDTVMSSLILSFLIF